jgi:hypothetical protein
MSRTSLAHPEDASSFGIGGTDGFRDRKEDLLDSRVIGSSPIGSKQPPTETDARFARGDDPTPFSVQEQASGNIQSFAPLQRAEAARRADAIEGLLLGSQLDWKPASHKQRRLIESIESRGARHGCSVDDHLAVVEQGINDHVGHFEDREFGEFRDWDPLADLRYHDDLWHPRTPRPVVMAHAKAESPIVLAWRLACPDRLEPAVEAELLELAATPEILDQGGEGDVANIVADNQGAPASVILTKVRERHASLKRWRSEEEPRVAMTKTAAFAARSGPVRPYARSQLGTVETGK